MNTPSHMLPMRIDRADFARSEYFLAAPPGTTVDDVIDPDFWVHVARRLKVNDRIEIVALDGSFDMEVRITSIDPRGLWAHVRPLRVAEGRFAVPEASGAYPDKDGYTVEWGGPHRWRIVRGNDVVARDFPDQAAAISALMNIKAAKRPAAVLPVRLSDPGSEPPEPAPVQEPVPEPAQPPEQEPPEQAPAASSPRLRGAAAASAARKAAA
jgi:hypothetical protein